MAVSATAGSARNRRTAYTRSVIRSTFFDLLNEKSLDKISVREICERADINRSTFYRHYIDINDLMQSIEDEFAAEINHQIEKMDPDVFDAAILGIFEVVKRNSDLCSYLLNCEIRRNLLASIFAENRDRTYKKWKNFFPGITDQQFQWMYVAFFNGIVGVIAEWTRAGLEPDPAEIVKFVTSIYFNGFRKYF